MEFISQIYGFIKIFKFNYENLKIKLIVIGKSRSIAFIKFSR